MGAAFGVAKLARASRREGAGGSTVSCRSRFSSVSAKEGSKGVPGGTGAVGAMAARSIISKGLELSSKSRAIRACQRSRHECAATFQAWHQLHGIRSRRCSYSVQDKAVSEWLGADGVAKAQAHMYPPRDNSCLLMARILERMKGRA